MNEKKRSHVIIYTDGACLNNPGPGGWAALLITGKRTREISGAEKHTTNNRMELTAALNALRLLKAPSDVDLYTDSTYLRNGIMAWLPNWRKHNWQRRGGKLANVDLWQALDKAVQKHNVQWHWVRGHAGDQYNQHVDWLARKAMKTVIEKDRD